MRRARIEENFFKLLMILSTTVVISSLAAILFTILIKGIPALSVDMITKLPEGGYYLGGGGGVLNAIVGSLMIAGGAVIVSLVISLPVVLYINVYLRKKSRRADVIRFLLDILFGVPSIVYGAFGFTIMLFFGLKASVLGGIIAVALLIMPIMCRTMDEVVKMMPPEMIDSSYALGATRFETAVKVILRQSFSGILTAIIISFGRGIGDAATVLFTAGFTDSIPDSLFRPAATLPLSIFFQLGTPFPEVQQRAYASALILTAIIFIVSAVSRFLSKRRLRNVVK